MCVRVGASASARVIAACQVASIPRPSRDYPTEEAWQKSTIHSCSFDLESSGKLWLKQLFEHAGCTSARTSFMVNSNFETSRFESRAPDVSRVGRLGSAGGAVCMTRCCAVSVQAYMAALLGLRCELVPATTFALPSAPALRSGLPVLCSMLLVPRRPCGTGTGKSPVIWPGPGLLEARLVWLGDWRGFLDFGDPPSCFCSSWCLDLQQLMTSHRNMILRSANPAQRN